MHLKNTTLWRQLQWYSATIEELRVIERSNLMHSKRQENLRRNEAAKVLFIKNNIHINSIW